MKNIKKVLSVLIVALMIISVAACGNSQGEEAETFNVGALKGPTGVGMVNLLDAEDSKIGDAQAKYTVAGAPDEIVGKLLSGELDAACVPGNMGPMLYNKSEGKFQVVSINTLGILYIVENTGKALPTEGTAMPGLANSSEDTTGNAGKYLNQLKGKTVYASGKGAMPEYILNYLFELNGLKVGKDVKVKYLSEHSEVAAKVASEKGAIAMLPEPFVTTVEAQSKGKVRRAMDITEIWNASASDTPLAMTVFVVNKEYAEKYPGTVNKFLDAYKNSVEEVNNNPEEAAKLCVKHNLIANEKIAAKAIPNCNIVFEKASENKEGLNALYKMLHGFNPKSVGGAVPGDDLYYEGY